jgi:hypothetical protein
VARAAIQASRLGLASLAPGRERVVNLLDAYAQTARRRVEEAAGLVAEMERARAAGETEAAREAAARLLSTTREASNAAGACAALLGQPAGRGRVERRG